MTTQEIDRYRQELQQQLTRLSHRRQELCQESMLGTGGEAGGGISNIPLHPADLGNRASEADVSIGLIENEERLIEDINLALARLDAGTFGRCENCGRPIEHERLDAVPYGRLCIQCARAQDRSRTQAEGGSARR